MKKNVKKEIGYLRDQTSSGYCKDDDQIKKSCFLPQIPDLCFVYN